MKVLQTILTLPAWHSSTDQFSELGPRDAQLLKAKPAPDIIPGAKKYSINKYSRKFKSTL